MKTEGANKSSRMRFSANVLLTFASLGLVFFLWQGLSGEDPDKRLLIMSGLGSVLAYETLRAEKRLNEKEKP